MKLFSVELILSYDTTYAHFSFLRYFLIEIHVCTLHLSYMLPWIFIQYII